MLIEFRAQNHRSLRDEQVLTMEAGRGGDPDDPRPRQTDGNAERLLTVAVLYGANASGKSNMLGALNFMRDAVLTSHRLWSADEGVPRDPFAWGPTRNEPSTFEVALVIDGVRYEYGFSATDDAFTEEWLWAWPKGKKQTWFNREGALFYFGEHLKGENKLIEEVTRPNALFLSAAVQHKHMQLQPVFSWFSALKPINLSTRRSFTPAWSIESAIARLLDEDNVEARQQPMFAAELPSGRMIDRFRSMLRNADIGILDLRVNKDDSDQPRRRFPNFYLKHQSDEHDAWLPLHEESRGTQTLFHMAWPVLQVLREGGALIVDELERSLHPGLAQLVVRQFNDPTTNPQNAQLLCTTHDTNLLGTTVGSPALRRDQVWLTEKSTAGASVVYPLTDYKPRKGENIERGYLQGRYGAIPFLSNLSLAGE